ncbi:nicotinate-nucleotide--dimethylbenzimidazole phosphoribosyltransferase [Ornithinimicrobium sp. Arc0846-15]|nr:nicotinate-nucleotide--dimethylbenzimidazole phosphoribosyltransferase [Ornithinimicrobium laminariae]
MTLALSDQDRAWLDELAASIYLVNGLARQRAEERQQTLIKPPGSLGELETISVRLAAILGSERPAPDGATVIVAAADHGVSADGVSAFPAAVTAAMTQGLLAPTAAGTGGAAISAIARSVRADVVVLDCGVNAELPDHPQLRKVAVRRGTDNLRVGPAMSGTEAVAMIRAGADAARAAIAGGADFVVPAEIGIGNTTAAAVITARALDRHPADVTGRGTGIDDAVLDHKIAVVAEALARADAEDPVEVLAEFGGFEIAAMVGMMLATADEQRVIVLDGFVEAAAALIAVSIAPAVNDYLVATGRCAERGHGAQLADLGLRPLWDLGLRLGEGTGGALAIPVLRAAAATLREMQTFAEAGVPTE